MRLRRFWSATAPAWAAAGMLVACNALSGLDDDYVVGLVPETPDGSRRDANDGRFDGGNGFDSGAIGQNTCPTGALFCDDFQDTTKVEPRFGWDRREAIGGTPEVAAQLGFSGTRGLRANANANGGSTKVSLWKTVPANLQEGRHLSLSFSFKVVSAGIDYAVIGAIQLNGLEYGLAVYRNAQCPGSGVCLDENDQFGSHDFSGSKELVTNQWYKAEIVVNRSGPSFGGRVVIDNGTALHDRSSGVLPGGLPSAVEIGVGTFYTGSNGVTETVIDDVVVRE